MSGRIDFSKNTKRIVAERSAYRCSFPECNKPTVGPGPTSDQSTLTGKAAHIFSASPAGPRGQGTLTEDELQSATNAIWLCSDHATLVDTHRGNKFPPELLLSFKALREAQVAREQNGINTPSGWFQEVLVAESPIFEPGARIRFGKLTVILGDNGGGKSAICEWLSSLADPSALGRWERPRGKPLKLQITYFDPAEQRARIEVQEGQAVTYFSDDRPVPFFPLRLGIVHLRNYAGILRGASEGTCDELDVVSNIMGVHASVVRALVPRINIQNAGCWSNIGLETHNGMWRLYAQHDIEAKPFRFMKMSDGQRHALLIELCVAMAKFYSETVPTLLILDGGMGLLDPAYFERYVSYLLAPDMHFQSLMTLVQLRNRPSWAGWEFVQLSGSNMDVRIDQSPFI